MKDNQDYHKNINSEFINLCSRKGKLKKKQISI